MYKKRLEQLCEKELLLEAKRKRAGRNHFLPGGWEDLKAPLQPLETWKLPLFELAKNDAGKLVGPFIRPDNNSWETTTTILPVLPAHELFARAWRRVEEGDPPRYEDVS